MAIIGDVNTGKSNLVYNLIEDLSINYNFNLFVYGLKFDLPSANRIHSLEELEKIRNSIVFLDEFQSLFDLDDRKKKKQIENTLRLINHNNNILVLIGICDNFKKFISSRISITFYKQVTFENFINGSSIKKNILNYCGYEKGSAILNLEVNEVIIFDGSYNKHNIKYLSKFDSKKKNVDIFVQKNTKFPRGQEKVSQKKSAESVPEKKCGKCP